MTESGWFNAWICTVLALRHLNQTLFDLSCIDRAKVMLPKMLEEMSLVNEVN